MDTNVLQTLRYKLQKRLKRINTAGFGIYHSILVQTWIFLNATPPVKGILDDLERRVPTAEQDSEKLYAGRVLTGENELEHVALCYWLVKRVAANSNAGEVVSLAHSLNRGVGKHDEALELFTEQFVEPLFDYLDEQIDDHRTTLALLRKYKHRVEWFCRDDLRQRFEAATQRGETLLAMDLYAYLHDQGLEFSIEPTSTSGEADLISAQIGDDRLIADVKIFDPGRSKTVTYLLAGFHQVYQYTKDYNSPFGYMVIFKTCEEDLSINALNQEAAVPFFTHNNKTIFTLIIDICDHQRSASKRGQLKSYELTETDLVSTLS